MKRRFIDIDRVIEEKAGSKIGTIVKKYGWNHFRKLEHLATQEICKEKNLVIATGGGTLMKAKNVKLLTKNAIIILLKASIPLLKKRLKHDVERPALTQINNTIKELEILWNKRKNQYENLADYTIEMGDEPVKMSLKKLLTLLR